MTSLYYSPRMVLEQGFIKVFILYTKRYINQSMEWTNDSFLVIGNYNITVLKLICIIFI